MADEALNAPGGGDADATALAEQVRSGALKAEDVAAAALERIRAMNPALGAFVHVDEDQTMAQARRVDAAVARGEDPGPLAGVPLGVKDLENAAGMPTRRGSLISSPEPAAAGSAQVERLTAAGAVVAGKTATPELGSLPFTWSLAHGAARNPWDRALTPGGSSGGSAAAVAAGLAPLATGSDGGGSLRMPAALCGIPTIKPTLGRIPRGPGRLGRSAVSVPGPLARSIRDLALYLDVTAGPHPLDPFSLPAPAASFGAGLAAPAPGRGLRAAFSATLGFAACDPELEYIARAAAERLIDAAGLERSSYEPVFPDAAMSWLGEVSLDMYAEMEQHWPAEAESMTPVVTAAMMMAASMEGPQIAEMMRLRHALVAAVAETFENVDVLITPAMPIPAFPAGGPTPEKVAGAFFPTAMGPASFVFSFNLTGNPAVCVPAGLDSSGLPAGIQLAGRRFSEALLLSVAAAYERKHPWPAPPGAGEAP